MRGDVKIYLLIYPHNVKKCSVDKLLIVNNSVFDRVLGNGYSLGLSLDFLSFGTFCGCLFLCIFCANFRRFFLRVIQVINRVINKIDTVHDFQGNLRVLAVFGAIFVIFREKIKKVINNFYVLLTTFHRVINRLLTIKWWEIV